MRRHRHLLSPLRKVLSAAVLSVTLAACSGGGATSDRPEVVTAFYPLAFAAETVGGSLITVNNLTPPGVEPHDLELSPGQVSDVASAALVVYMGHGFQPAVDDAVAQLDEGKAIDVLGGQDLLTPAEEQSRDITETIGETESGGVDPHVWLDPNRMITIVQRVADGLAQADPSNEATFTKNAGELISRLSTLDDTFSSGLAHCASRDIVTSHAAFAYLADRYGLRQISVSGLDPAAEPSPGRLEAIARLIKERGITTVFSEELAPPEIADTLSSESGAVVKVLSPLETAPASGDYFTAMKTNLDELRAALACD